MKHFQQSLSQSDFIPYPTSADIDAAVSSGQRYMDRNIPRKTSISKLFFIQMQYLSPFLWLMQFASLIFIVVVAFTAKDMSYETAASTMLLVAPLTAIFAVPEFFKDISCGLLEMEMSCKNSGASTLSIRLIIIGFINIIMLSLFSCILALSWLLRFLSIILYGIVPVNIIYILNFLFFHLFRICSRVTALSCAIITSIAAYIATSQIAAIQHLSGIVWIGIFIVTTILLVGQCIVEIARISKRQEVDLRNF